MTCYFDQSLIQNLLLPKTHVTQINEQIFITENLITSDCHLRRSAA